MPNDALLIGEDGALSIHPDGDALIVFDSETGAGAECCCGESPCPGCSGDCCFNTGLIVPKCGPIGCIPAMKGRCFRLRIQTDESGTYSKITGTGCKNVPYYWRLSMVGKFASKRVGSACSITVGEKCCESLTIDAKTDLNGTPCNPVKLQIAQCSDDPGFAGNIAFIENSGQLASFFGVYTTNPFPITGGGLFCTGRAEHNFGGDSTISYLDQTITRGCSGDVFSGTFSYSMFLHQLPSSGNSGFDLVSSGTASWSIEVTDDCPAGRDDGEGVDSAETSGDFI